MGYCQNYIVRQGSVSWQEVYCDRGLASWGVLRHDTASQATTRRRRGTQAGVQGSQGVRGTQALGAGQALG